MALPDLTPDCISSPLSPPLTTFVLFAEPCGISNFNSSNGTCFLTPSGFCSCYSLFFFLLEGSFVWLVKSTGSEMRLPGLESWLPISQSFAFLGLDGEDDDRGDVSDGISFQGIL